MAHFLFSRGNGVFLIGYVLVLIVCLIGGAYATKWWTR